MQTHNALQQHTNNLHEDLDSHNQKPACKPTKCNGYGQLYYVSYVLTDQLSVGRVGWILPRPQSLVAQHDVTCDQAFFYRAPKNKTERLIAGEARRGSVRRGVQEKNARNYTQYVSMEFPGLDKKFKAFKALTTMFQGHD